MYSRFFQDGHVSIWPSKRSARAHVLLWLVSLFDPGCIYTESEVNKILSHQATDVAFMRRELVDYGYLQRDSLGSYRLADEPVARVGSIILHAEAPAWESVWLPSYLAGRAESYL